MKKNLYTVMAFAIVVCSTGVIRAAEVPVPKVSPGVQVTISDLASLPQGINIEWFQRIGKKYGFDLARKLEALFIKGGPEFYEQIIEGFVAEEEKLELVHKILDDYIERAVELKFASLSEEVPSFRENLEIIKSNKKEYENIKNRAFEEFLKLTKKEFTVAVKLYVFARAKLIKGEEIPALQVPLRPPAPVPPVRPSLRQPTPQPPRRVPAPMPAMPSVRQPTRVQPQQPQPVRPQLTDIGILQHILKDLREDNKDNINYLIGDLKEDGQKWDRVLGFKKGLAKRHLLIQYLEKKVLHQLAEELVQERINQIRQRQ